MTNHYAARPPEEQRNREIEATRAKIWSTAVTVVWETDPEVIRAVRDFYDQRGFILCDTPIFTPAACEGTTTLFEVGYFDEKAYLTQSGQLYNEATETIASLKRLSVQVSDQLNAGRGTLGRFLKDEEVYNRTNALVARLDETSNRL